MQAVHYRSRVMLARRQAFGDHQALLTRAGPHWTKIVSTAAVRPSDNPLLSSHTIVRLEPHANCTTAPSDNPLLSSHTIVRLEPHANCTTAPSDNPLISSHTIVCLEQHTNCTTAPSDNPLLSSHTIVRFEPHANCTTAPPYRRSITNPAFVEVQAAHLPSTAVAAHAITMTPVLPKTRTSGKVSVRMNVCPRTRAGTIGTR